MPHSLSNTATIPFSKPTWVHKTVCNICAQYARGPGMPHAQELDVDLFSLLVYPLRSRGKDGHFADAQIVSG